MRASPEGLTEKVTARCPFTSTQHNNRLGSPHSPRMIRHGVKFNGVSLTRPPPTSADPSISEPCLLLWDCIALHYTAGNAPCRSNKLQKIHYHVDLVVQMHRFGHPGVKKYHTSRSTMKINEDMAFKSCTNYLYVLHSHLI